MFNRNTMSQIETDFNTTGPNIVRMEGVARAVTRTLQILISSLSVPAQLWAAGVEHIVMSTVGDDKPQGSNFTRRYWLALQMALAIFTVSMKMPVKSLLSLAVVVDDKVVLDGEGKPIYPFRVFDPTHIAPVFMDMSIELLVYIDPESNLPQ